MKYQSHLIPSNLKLLAALEILEKIDIKCLIVLDKGLVVGTITDGDIRRSLLIGFGLSTQVSSIMNTDFTYIESINACGIYFLPKLKSNLIPIVGENKELNDIALVSYKGYISFADAVIMAGGKGTRLYPLTKSKPKPLVYVDETKKMRIIDLPLRLLEKYGFQNVFIIVNYMGEQIEMAYTQSVYSFEIKFLKETQFKGTFGSLYDFKDNFTTEFFMINCDVYTTLNIYKMYTNFSNSCALISVAGKTVDHYIDFGVINTDNSTVHIIEKPTYKYKINMGIYWINRDVFNKTKPNSSDGLWHITDEINFFKDSSSKATSYEHLGSWIDIGRINDLELIRNIIE